MLIAALALPFALLQAEAAPSPPDRFAACVAAIETDAARAYEEAMAWGAETRTREPYRCAAMALVALDRADEAGRRFESLAEDAEPEERAELLSQAGNAFLIARARERALAAFGAALALVGADDPARVDLLIDRSLAHALGADWRGAEEDLNRALDLAPNSALALRLRAAARMRQGAHDLAERDARAAIAIAPTDVEARLVLGHVLEAKRTGEAPAP